MSKPAFIFICGSDDFLVTRAGNVAWEHLCKEIEDPHACERIDGQAGNYDEVVRVVDDFSAAVQTISLFGDRKAVWLRDINFMGESVTGKSEGAKQQVERLLEILGGIDPQFVAVLVTASGVDRRRRSFKWLQANSDFTYIEDSKDGGNLVSTLVEEARSMGCRLTDSAARALLARIQFNSRLALEEVRKLCTYLGAEGGLIDEALIISQVPVYGEGDFFEATEAFFSRKAAWAVDAIRRHFFSGHPARPLITSIQGRNRLLIQIRVLQDQGLLGSGVNAAALDRARRAFGHHWKGLEAKSGYQLFTQHPFYLSRLAANARNFTLRELISNQVECLNAFRELLNRPDDEEAVMREFALRCLH